MLKTAAGLQGLHHARQRDRPGGRHRDRRRVHRPGRRSFTDVVHRAADASVFGGGRRRVGGSFTIRRRRRSRGRPSSTALITFADHRRGALLPRRDADEQARRAAQAGHRARAEGAQRGGPACCTRSATPCSRRAAQRGHPAEHRPPPPRPRRRRGDRASAARTRAAAHGDVVVVQALTRCRPARIPKYASTV